jgi:hypothetical protein
MDLVSVSCRWVTTFPSNICWRGCLFSTIYFWHLCQKWGGYSCVDSYPLFLNFNLTEINLQQVLPWLTMYFFSYNLGLVGTQSFLCYPDWAMWGQFRKKIRKHPKSTLFTILSEWVFQTVKESVRECRKHWSDSKTENNFTSFRFIDSVPLLFLGKSWDLTHYTKISLLAKLIRQNQKMMQLTSYVWLYFGKLETEIHAK